MDNLALLDETASLLEMLDDVLVGSLDVLTLEVADFRGEVKTSSPFAAMSAVGIHYKYNSSIKGKVIKIIFVWIS